MQLTDFRGRQHDAVKGPGDGHFRIDYSGASFRRTPFSPSINLEWSGGPDLYFRIEAADGAGRTFIAERRLTWP